MFKAISERKVWSLKDRICAWCNEVIPKAENHVYRVYKFESDFQHDRMHLECAEAMKRTPCADLSQGFEEGEFLRGKTPDETEEINMENHRLASEDC